jgi:hypothetical protein
VETVVGKSSAKPSSTTSGEFESAEVCEPSNDTLDAGAQALTALSGILVHLFAAESAISSNDRSRTGRTH